ncbi:STAS-like domain-containing protein [uncultured Draconibacterium sp.]|uniref:STAS-like domain-containing protein n=1 Tax=uncultured Draconibacterium sp. TaxID=1573823 RepID=UPI002AA654C7|nr:STAS-like domain-containing protein [uncultured Draconibacterium sp.]
MTQLDLTKYGPIISSQSIGNDIYQLIKTSLKSDNKVVIDISNIKSMATFCAKQIFGKLYLELGSQSFFESIEIKGADDDLKTIIQIGIQHALEEKE